MTLSTLIIIFFSFSNIYLGSASILNTRCGDQANGTLCPDFLCCSRFGFCNTTEAWCGSGCQSQCWSQERSDGRCGPEYGYSPCGKNRCCSIFGWCGAGSSYCNGGNCQYRCWYFSDSPSGNKLESAISKILSKSLFDEMFMHRKDCPSQGFYSYDAFLSAAASFPSFGNTGDLATRKRELAAFLAQTSQATTGRWLDSKDPHAWGYCHVNTTVAIGAGTYENDIYCTSPKFPCAYGKKYNSRGPIQLTYNYNYGLAGEALGLDLINDPDLVATDPVVSFKTALWLWMTEHENKPSCHDVLVKASDSKPSRGLSYGHVISNIINGASGRLNALGTDSVTSSVGYYKRYCDMLEVSYGDNLSLWFEDMRSLEVSHIKMPVL